MFFRSSTVSPIVMILVPPENVVSNQSAAVVISISAVPAITDVQVFPPSESVPQPLHSAVNVTSDNVNFEFHLVDRYYNGTYTVNFTNAVGSSTVDFQLTVYFGPYFSYEGEEQINSASISKTFSEGEDVTIVCDVAATNPAVSSLMLSMSTDVNNVDFDEGTGTITITRATVDNEGTYTCTADNGETNRTNISFVLTIDMPSTTDSAGNFLETVSVVVVMLLAVFLFS